MRIIADRGHCALQAGDAAPRNVPPSRDAATRALRIDGFVRPLTAKACKEMLAKSGGALEHSVCGFMFL